MFEAIRRADRGHHGRSKFYSNQIGRLWSLPNISSVSGTGCRVSSVALWLGLCGVRELYLMKVTDMICIRDKNKV